MSLASSHIAATASLTLRRNLRRKRAAARRAWFLHSRGITLLGPDRLRQVFHTLRQHHSKDSRFLQLIQRAMSSQHQDNAGWMCGNWRKMRSKNALFCDLCGMAWEDCIVYPKKNQGKTRSASRKPYWTEPQHPPWGDSYQTQSPRQSPRTKQHNHSKKNKGKGRGRGQQPQQVLAPPPPPALDGPGSQPPWMSMPLLPGTAASSSPATLSPAE